MRKLVFIMAGLLALGGVEFAVANGFDGPKSIKAVAATFNATASSSKTRTCTTTDGKTIAVTNGRYSGTAAGDPDLSGPIRLFAHSVVNTTDGVGVVHGRLRIDVASGRDTVADFATAYDHGNIAGLARGHAHDPFARLLANVSAGFIPDSGFSSGKIGNSAGGAAVEVGPGNCQPSHAVEKSRAVGTVSALSHDSITVAGLSCMLPPNLADHVNAKFKVGDRAEIRCALIGGKNTLVSINKRR